MTYTKLSVVLLIFLLRKALSCPTACVCKWKNGKQTVECVDKGLLIIPDGMDSGTQVLEFSGNNLQTLHDEKFLRMDLINLQRIYLSRCHISRIDDRTFNGLTNLVELDLSGNLLEIVPTRAFLDCPSLMRLTLSSNPIKIVKKEAFSYLRFLNILELSRCEIMQVEEGAFHGLNSLEWLRLDRNHLRTLKGKFVLPENLRGVELQGNMWECDCHLLELRKWLETFSIPQSVEPVCTGPLKLAKRAVKSIPASELACLPDVSPTTFYLEIGEGKNVSLLCQISAIPEAHVSWWFQGQLLQNDTLVGPDTRLIYYIEEGTEDKRSELFIYNTNPEDNGTFICNAENPAGTVQSNFTIRIVIKEEPKFEIPMLPFQFLVIVISATSVSLIVICCALIITIIKCQCQKKKCRTKEITQNLIQNNSTKDSLLQESLDEYSEVSKGGSDVTLVDREQIVLYANQTNEELFGTIALTTASSLNCYQLEQNPDLINDTESIGRRREGDGGEDKHPNIKYEEITENFELSSNLLPHTFLQTTEKRCNRDLYRLSADVHLNPVGLLHSRALFNGNCYRTLPYNRGGKRQSAETPPKYREAEFLSKTLHPASYEHYTLDVRYTADGYPARSDEQETQFSDCESVRSCCSAPTVQWPVSILKNPEENIAKLVMRKSVGAQTQTDSIPPISKITECPDEGYEGDSVNSDVATK